jgi:hypothetical protein
VGKGARGEDIDFNSVAAMSYEHPIVEFEGKESWDCDVIRIASK